MLLEVYPDLSGAEGDIEASGTLYLDDGESHGYQRNERTQVNFLYDGKKLSVTKLLHDVNQYAKAATKYVNEIKIYNQDKEPTSIKNLYVKGFAGARDQKVDFVYIASSKEIHITNLALPVDEGLTYGKIVDLLQINFWTDKRRSFS